MAPGETQGVPGAPGASAPANSFRRGEAAARGEETECSLGEWNKESEGVLIAVVGGVKREGISRIPERKLHVAMEGNRSRRKVTGGGRRRKELG